MRTTYINTCVVKRRVGPDIRNLDYLVPVRPDSSGVHGIKLPCIYGNRIVRSGKCVDVPGPTLVKMLTIIYGQTIFLKGNSLLTKKGSKDPDIKKLDCLFREIV